MMQPLPEATITPAQDRLGSGASKILVNSKAERGGAESRYRWTTPQAASIVLLAAPLSDGCRGKLIYGSSQAHYSAHVSDRCDSGQNKKHTFSKREQKSFSAYHKRPALMQPFCTAVSTPCHAGRCLAGHPRCVNVGNDYGKTS